MTILFTSNQDWGPWVNFWRTLFFLGQERIKPSSSSNKKSRRKRRHQRQIPGHTLMITTTAESVEVKIVEEGGLTWRSALLFWCEQFVMVFMYFMFILAFYRAAKSILVGTEWKWMIKQKTYQPFSVIHVVGLNCILIKGAFGLIQDSVNSMYLRATGTFARGGGGVTHTLNLRMFLWIMRQRIWR